MPINNQQKAVVKQILKKHDAALKKAVDDALAQNNATDAFDEILVVINTQTTTTRTNVSSKKSKQPRK